MTTTIERRPAFTRLDRCDRCGAPAALQFVVTKGGTPLLLCVMHMRLHKEAIGAQAAAAWDVNGRVLFERSARGNLKL